MQVYNWLKIAHFRVLPPRCLVCAGHGAGLQEICVDCVADLPWQKRGCRHCGLTLPPQAAAELCPDCQRKPAPFTRAHCAFEYAAPVSQLISGLKFQRKLANGRLLGSLFSGRMHGEIERPDFILPVPLHRGRLRQRGFNQAAELASIVGRRLDIPVCATAARRIRATAVQSDLPASRRRANLRGAFSATVRLLQDRHVALFDDVVTTASTVRALAESVHKAGAHRVDLWSIARA